MARDVMHLSRNARGIDVCSATKARGGRLNATVRFQRTPGMCGKTLPVEPFEFETGEEAFTPIMLPQAAPAGPRTAAYRPCGAPRGSRRPAFAGSKENR